MFIRSHTPGVEWYKYLKALITCENMLLVMITVTPRCKGIDLAPRHRNLQLTQIFRIRS